MHICPFPIIIATIHNLSSSIVHQVISLLDQGYSARHICSQTSVSLASISRTHSQHSSGLPTAPGGCPKNLSSTATHRAICLCTTQKNLTPAKAAKLLSQATDKPVQPWTVRRALKKDGLKAVVKRKRPEWLARHKKARLEFAEWHLNWTVDDWKRVLYTDETKINCLGSDGRQYAWKRPGENLSDCLVQGTRKLGGGSLMMWDCMLWEGPEFATRVEGKMDADLYVSILE
jgi:transposase